MKQQKQRGRGRGRDEAQAAAEASIIDLKMELALEMSKFIGEIEYQLQHVVPMADLCFVGDRHCWMFSLTETTNADMTLV